MKKKWNIISWVSSIVCNCTYAITMALAKLKKKICMTRVTKVASVWQIQEKWAFWYAWRRESTKRWLTGDCILAAYTACRTDKKFSDMCLLYFVNCFRWNKEEKMNLHVTNQINEFLKTQICDIVKFSVNSVV